MNTKSLKVNAILSGLRQCCKIIFPLITIPVVSRIIGSEKYGKVNFASSFVEYFILLSAFGVTSYAIREGAKLRENKNELQTFENEIFTINIITTIISYTLLFFLLLLWDNIRDYRMLIVVQSLSIIFTTLGTEWNNNIFEDFAYTTIRYIIIQAIAVSLMLLLIHDKADYYIYVWITVFASVGGNIVNIFYIRRKYIKVKLTRHINLKKHIRPMVYLFANALATTIYVNCDITLLTLLVNNMVTGVYSIAVKIYTIVKQIMQAMVGVVLPRLCYLLGQNKTEEYNEVLNKIFHAMVLFILPCVIGLFMLSENIIQIIAGTEYVSGYIALKILAVALILSVMSYFYTYAVMIPNNLEKYCLNATLISALINILLNFIFIPKYSLNGAAFTTALSEMIVLGCCIYYSRGLYELKIQLNDYIPCIVGSIEVVLVCIVVRKLQVEFVTNVVLSIILSALVYFGTLILLKDKIVSTAIKKYLKSWLDY